MLRRAAPGLLQTVGLVTPEPDIPPEILYQLQMQGQRMPPPEYEQVRRFLERDYQVERVALTGGAVPATVDVLVVIDPRQLSESAVYQLDQYLMRGGRVVLCAGRYRPTFETQGLAAVAKNAASVHREYQSGHEKSYFLALYPDVAVSAACVTCHNNHPESPRRDFKVGDVMGGVVISVPLRAQ